MHWLLATIAIMMMLEFAMSWKACFIACLTLGAVNVALFALVPIRPAPPMPEKPLSPLHMILGDWQEVGNASHVLRITPTETIFIVGGKISEGDGLTVTHTIDWTTNPLKIELQPRSQRERLIPGVLKFEGDRMKLALRTFNPSPDKDGPLDFANADTRIEYQRIK
jgi:hypothetical protein